MPQAGQRRAHCSASVLPVAWNDARGTHIETLNALPLRFWQSVQWHAYTVTGSAVTRYCGYSLLTRG